MRNRDRHYSNLDKAQVLVVAAHESVNVAANKFGIDRRSIFNWRKQLETDEELQAEYKNADLEYRSAVTDLLKKSEQAYLEYLSWASEIRTMASQQGKMSEFADLAEKISRASKIYGDKVLEFRKAQNIERMISDAS